MDRTLIWESAGNREFWGRGSDADIYSQSVLWKNVWCGMETLQLLSKYDVSGGTGIYDCGRNLVVEAPGNADGLMASADLHCRRIFVQHYLGGPVQICVPLLCFPDTQIHFTSQLDRASIIKGLSSKTTSGYEPIIPFSFKSSFS